MGYWDRVGQMGIKSKFALAFAAFIVLVWSVYVWANPASFTKLRLSNGSDYTRCLLDALVDFEESSRRKIAILAGSNPPYHKMLTKEFSATMSALYDFADSMGHGAFHAEAMRMLAASGPQDEKLLEAMNSCKPGRP